MPLPPQRTNKHKGGSVHHLKVIPHSSQTDEFEEQELVKGRPAEKAN